MQENEPSSNGESSDQDQHLNYIVARYVDRLNAGERVNAQQVLRDHPEVGNQIMEELQVFLDLGADEFHDSFDIAPCLGTLGDYTLRRQIGRGGMGVVYEAWQGSLDRQIALKVLPAGAAADDKTFHRFMREAKTTAKLNHPNIVGVHGVGIEQNTPYYAMEFVEGETLAQILSKLKEADSESETPFGPKDEGDYFIRLARCFAAVADGLQHAHSKGVVHRDIKPSNLILDGEGKLRILDFGLARLEGQESLTLSGDLMGTVLYMSPEQAMAKRIPLDHRTDVYSLGATTYEMLTGRPPFRGKDSQSTLSEIILRDPQAPRKLNPRIPQDLETIALKCLRKDAADRYGTAEALGQDLRRFVKGDPIEARPQPQWERVARRAWRARGRIAVGALTVLLSVAGLWIASYLRDAREVELRKEYDRLVLETISRVGYYSATGGGSLAPPETITELRQAIELFPERPEARYYRAVCLDRMRRHDEARDELEALFELSPDFLPAVRAWNELAGDFDPPLPERRIDADTLTGWEKLYWDASEPNELRIPRPEAFDALIEWIGEQGEEPFLGLRLWVRMGRASELQAARDPVGAQRDYAALHGRYPRLVAPAARLGQALLLMKDADGARRHFERCVRASPYPDDLILHVVSYYGSAYHPTRGVYHGGYAGYPKQFRELLGWLDRVEGEDPRKLALQHNLHRQLGEDERCLVLCERLLELLPDNTTALAYQGRALWKLRAASSERIERIFQRALELDPDCWVCYEQYAAWCRAQGDPERGLELYRNCFRVKPWMQLQPYWLKNLTYYLIAANRWKEAEETLDRALKIEPLAGAHNARGQVRASLGNTAGAFHDYRRALELNPDDVGPCEDLEHLLRTAEIDRIEADRLANWLESKIDLGLTAEQEEPFLRLLVLAVGKSGYQGKMEAILEDYRKEHPRLAMVAQRVRARLWRDTDLHEAIRAAEEIIRDPEAGFEDREFLRQLYRKSSTPLTFGAVDRALEEEDLVAPDVEWDYWLGIDEEPPGDWQAGDVRAAVGSRRGPFDREVLREAKTLYLWTRFQVDDPARFRSLRLFVQRGRGFVVYLNGEEVGRRDAGRPGDAHGPRSLSVRPLARPEPIEVRFSPSRLRRGENVLAIHALSTPVHFQATLVGEMEWGAKSARAVLDRLSKGGEAVTEALRTYLEARIAAVEERWDKAIATLRTLVESEYDTSLVRLRLAEALSDGGYPEKALECLEEAFRRRGFRDRGLLLAWLRVALGDLKLGAPGTRSRLEELARDPAKRGDVLEGWVEDVLWALEHWSGSSSLRINSGGGEYRCGAANGTVDGRDARVFESDRLFLGGSLYMNGERSFSGEIAETDDDPLYRTERWFPADSTTLAYAIPLEPGTYHVTLHLAELWWGVSAKGFRQFGIAIDGQRREPLAYEPKTTTAERLSYDVDVADGLLEIDLIHISGNPQICALEVQRIGE